MKAYMVVFVDDAGNEHRSVVYADSPNTASFKAGIQMAAADLIGAMHIREVIAARPLSERQWFENIEVSRRAYREEFGNMTERPEFRMRGDIRD